MKNWLFLLGLVACIPLCAQFRVEGLVQNTEGEELPFVHVLNLTMDMGQVSATNGRFRILAERGDTILFSCIGYESAVLQVEPEHLVNFIKITLINDTLQLPSITIYADRALRVPLRFVGQPMEIEGIAKPSNSPPIVPGTIRAGAPNMLPGLTISGPFSYFSASEQERRKMIVVEAETSETINYQKFISNDSMKVYICRLYGISPERYDLEMRSINIQHPEVLAMTNRREIWNWINAYFERIRRLDSW